MKRWLLSLMAVASTGCLYDAPPAPGRPEPADPAVVGSWRCVSGDDGETTLMTVTPQADARYAVTLASRSEAPDHYEAYAVTRSGSRLVNVQEVGEKGSRKWNLARYSLPRRDALLVEQLGDVVGVWVIKHKTYEASAVLGRRAEDSQAFDFP